MRATPPPIAVVLNLTEQLIELELKLANLLKTLQDQRNVLKQLDVNNNLIGTKDED
jgi:hypothetical protein